MRLIGFFLPFAVGEEVEGQGLFRYRRLWFLTVSVTSFFAITPLLILMGMNYHQFEHSLEVAIEHEIEGLLSEKVRSLESFLEERTAALKFIVRARSYADLTDPARLSTIWDDLRISFGGYVDIGVFDATGGLLRYVGGDRNPGQDYSRQEWFQRVWETGAYVSDVFLGYRKFPHFVIAVTGTNANGEEFVLRATIDAKVLTDLVAPVQEHLATDIFMMNREGVLQTPSRFCAAGILDPCPMDLAVPADRAIWQDEDEQGRRRFFGHAEAAGSPFVFIVVKRPTSGEGTYFERRGELLGFTLASMIVIVLLLMGMASYLVFRIREADLKRAKVLHNIEYTNKMASLGRLAAGVAHEINNPLAIINEKAGLLKDLGHLEENSPGLEKRMRITDSVLAQVDRCRAITHRLLGFAKRMDVHMEALRLDQLLTDVLSFLTREAESRNVQVELSCPDDFPTIRSDRGQLQQVFLNILNNAFQAVEDGGHVRIELDRPSPETISVAIRDDGCGIPQEDLKSIFEPFFTTKKTYGTGLGLSITYGIVSKLGGRIDVVSEVGTGTTFRVILPLEAGPEGGAA